MDKKSIRLGLGLEKRYKSRLKIVENVDVDVAALEIFYQMSL